MKNIYKLFAPITMLLSLSTVCGVLLHDTNIDKAFMSAWSVADSSTSTEDASKVKLGSTPHTHAHGISLADTIQDGQAHPCTAPRSGDRKHIHQKRVARGGHGFDGYRLLLHSLFA